MSATEKITIINDRNKRIASNSILLFLRMFIVTIVNLVSVRLVLKALGEVDYGIYNAVAVLTTMATFISYALSFSFQRFLSVAIGEQDTDKFKQTFTHGVNIVVAISMVIVIVFEILGPWFMYEHMTIPPERMEVAQCLFHFSLASFVFTFMLIPFTAVLFSNEDMACYSLISTIDCILKLGVSGYLFVTGYDHLLTYGIGLLVVAISTFVLYAVSVFRRHNNCSYVKGHNIHVYKQLLTFSGWTLFGSVANTGTQQGSVILINVFFGPVVNTAFAVATQVSNAFIALCNNIAIPFRPAMIRAYAEGNMEYVRMLYYASNKLFYYLSLIIALPMIIEMDEVLNIWLDYVTPDTVLFSRMTVVYAVVLILHNPITIIIHATGKVALYHSFVDGIMLISFPVTWFLYNLGLPAHCVYLSITGACTIAHATRLICLSHNVDGFTIVEYITRFALPALGITLLMAVCLYWAHGLLENAGIRMLFEGILSCVATTILVYAIALSKAERSAINNIIKKKTGR